MSGGFWIFLLGIFGCDPSPKVSALHRQRTGWWLGRGAIFSMPGGGGGSNVGNGFFVN